MFPENNVQRSGEIQLIYNLGAGATEVNCLPLILGLEDEVITPADVPQRAHHDNKGVNEAL